MPRQNAPVPPRVPLELWRELYQAAARFQKLAPWTWMDDTHVFGISDANGVRLGSVLGGMEEVFGIVFYRGSIGAYCLLTLLNGTAGPDDSDTVARQDALFLSFSPTRDLDAADREIMRAIDFQPVPSKPKLHPQFRSHKPGYVPWFLDEREARQLVADLELAIPFAVLIRDQGNSCGRRADAIPFLPIENTGPLHPSNLEWRRVVADVPIDPVVDPAKFDLAKVASLPQSAQTVWELTAFYSSMSVGDTPRPYLPKLCLAVDATSGAIVDFVLSDSDCTMSEALARGLAHAIARSGFRPQTVRLDSIMLAYAAEPVFDTLEIRRTVATSLPMAKEARRSLDSFSRQQ